MRTDIFSSSSHSSFAMGDFVLLKRFSLATGIIFASIMTSATAAIAGAPAVFSDWKKIAVAQDVCMQRAETDLTNNGFVGGGGGIKGTGTTYYGFRGDYTGTIRCAAADGDPGIVYFIVAGPTADEASSSITALWNGF